MTTRATRVYLAGPMRGIAEFNFPAFREAAEALRGLGYEVFNPAERDESIGFTAEGLDGNEDLAALGFNLRDALGADLDYVSHKADAVVTLPGAENSSGARAEVATAKALGLPVVESVDLIHSYFEDGCRACVVENSMELYLPVEREDDCPSATDDALEALLREEERIERATLAADATGGAFPRPPYAAGGVITSRKSMRDGELFVPLPPADRSSYPVGARPLEVRIVSSTGGEKGDKPCKLGYVDSVALEELGRVADMGAIKYAPGNYLKGYAWSLAYNALYRHFLAWQRGEDRDPESGLLHTAHIAWQALALCSFQLRGIGTDDRLPALEVN